MAGGANASSLSGSLADGLRTRGNGAGPDGDDAAVSVAESEVRIVRTPGNTR